MLGKLTIDALPFYSWVAMGGALVTVVGGAGRGRGHHLVRTVALLCGANG